MARDSLYYFAKVVLGYDRFVPRIHKPICDTLGDLSRARVNITMPRKFYKSTAASIAYPLWRAVLDPNITILLAMNIVDNAKLKLDELKNHVTMNPMLRALFPEIVPSDRQWSATKASLRRESTSGTPTWSIAGATTTVVSRAVDEIVMDDLVTAKQDDVTDEEILPTKEDIRKAIGWYRGALSLLKDPLNGRLLNVGTRWAKKDLVEHLIRTNPRYQRNNFELKALDEQGRPTMPENYPMEALEEVRRTQGSTIFHLWYLNEPVDPTELIFDLHPEENFYRSALQGENWAGHLRIYTGVDLAFSDKEKADNNAIVTIGVDSENIRYVLDVQYGHWSPMETVDRIFAVNSRFHPRVIGIESVAGQALMPRLMPHFMRERGEALPIREVQRRGKQSKENRIMFLQPWVEQRLLKLPVGMAKPLEAEMRDFRLDEKRRDHDDALDALADAVRLSTATSPPRQNTNRRRTPDEWKELRERAYVARHGGAAVLDELLGEGGETQLPFDRQLKGVHFHYLEN